ncbi:MAG: murein biosynthesis integral membrane protein MurJ [bacterium]
MQKLWSLFTSKNSLGVASIILVATTAMSRLMGIPRDYFLAQKIPSGDISIYNAGFLIPDFIVNILIIGAISAAFIPVFINYLSTKKKDQAFEIANQLLNIGLIIILVYSVLMFIFAPYVMKLLVPGFSGERLADAVLISRILIVNPIFFSLAYIFGGILNSFKRFLAYSLAPIFYNLGIILGTVLFADEYGILAPAFGAIAGAFMHMLIQAFPAFSLGYRYKFAINWKNKGVREIGHLMLPRTIGLAASQVSFIVIIAIASMYDPEDIALFIFANNIAAFIPSVFGVTLAIAVFPNLAEKIALNQRTGFAKTFSLVFRQIFFIVLPLIALLLIFRAQAVRILLGSGHFDWENTVVTATILGVMALYMFAQSLIPLLARSFYAMKNTRTPVIISIVGIVITILSGLILAHGWNYAGQDIIPSMGVVGLGWALSIGASIHLIWLFFALHSKIGKIEQKTNLLNISKVIFITLLMTAVAQSGKYLIEPILDTHTRLGLILQVGIVSIFALAVYIGISYLFKLPELNKLSSFFKRKTRVKELTEAEQI